MKSLKHLSQILAHPSLANPLTQGFSNFGCYGAHEEINQIYGTPQ